MTKDVLQDETDVEKGPSAKARTPPNDTFTMVLKSKVQRLVVSHQEEKNIILFDRIALEKDICVATKADRIQKLTHECKRLHDLARTQKECKNHSSKSKPIGKRAIEILSIHQA